MNIIWKLCAIIGMVMIITAVNRQERLELNTSEETNESGEEKRNERES
jgi:hypothetical protein